MRTFTGKNFYLIVLLTSALIIGLTVWTTEEFTVSSILWLLGSLFIVVYCMQGGGGYYFEVYKNKLVIKNHFWFWVHKEYNYTQIKRITTFNITYTSGLEIETNQGSEKYASSLTSGEEDEIRALMIQYKVNFID